MGAKEASELCGEQPPEKYIQKLEDRFEELEIDQSDIEIPLIDFGAKHENVVKNVAEACREWGFFQVINHGLTPLSIQSIFQLTREFSDLSEKEKNECNVLSEKFKSFHKDDAAGLLTYGSGFGGTGKKAYDWRDRLMINVSMVKQLNAWPSSPPSFRDIVEDYHKQILNFTQQLLKIISQGLGLEPETLDKGFGYSPRQMLLMNYYPACNKPELVKGIPAHSDASGVTVLLQDDVGGLEVLNNGQWVYVKPLNNALIINIGDHVEMLTNGVYKSPQHRARVNNVKPRISVPFFYGPGLETKVQPLPELISEGKPALYKECITKHYIKRFYSGYLDGKTALDYFKI